MMWHIILAVVLALGVLLVMRSEIVATYCRFSDYLLVTPLLLGAGAIMAWLGQRLADLEGVTYLVTLPVQLALGFFAMAVIWGGVLTGGAFFIKLFSRS